MDARTHGKHGAAAHRPAAAHARARGVRPVPRPVPPLAGLAAAVLVSGLVTAATHAPTDPAGPRVVAPVAATAPEAPVAVPLEVRHPPVPAPAHDPGDPATWSSRRLAAQLVFSCVQTADLGLAVAHAQAGLGGIALLGRPTDGAALAAGLAQVRAAGPDGTSPLLASDEEGGRVQRLRGVLGTLPTAEEMGSWPDARIEQTAHDYAAGMRALGLHAALSPVADLALPGGYVAETRRGFSADPARAASAAVAWSRGLERAGVLSVVKHWPGHGGAADSHTEAPEVPPLEALEGRDLRPFDEVLRAGGTLVMVGHLRSPGLTEPGVPATLSPNALRVLRERAGPAAVLLTDSVSMAASSAALGIAPAEAAVRAVSAGADWAMSCVDPLVAVDALTAALDAGTLPTAEEMGSWPDARIE
ncbi:MAG TPA: glycoside hydrolase family 3 N-terminal domain-containing protein, partial [Mycobacteriales bacterium]|nr:glycoside hydrolase family 3 N-terminal domain-containing protein [Mycobacteriales bacterium]